MTTDSKQISNPENKVYMQREDSDQDYRSISKSAVACLVFAVLSLLAFLSSVFVLFPLLATVFGISALKSFAKYPGELVGKPLAKYGLIVGALCLVSSIAMHVYIYNTEVPDGYERIAFSQLRPNTKTGLPFAEKAKELDGKKVFLKGYVRPSDRKYDLKKFILVGDFGDCCFGGNPEITDIVAINIICDETVNYSFRTRKIGGTFRLHQQAQQVRDEKDIPGIFYEIEADHIK